MAKLFDIDLDREDLAEALHPLRDLGQYAEAIGHGDGHDGNGSISKQHYGHRLKQGRRSFDRRSESDRREKDRRSEDKALRDAVAAGGGFPSKPIVLLLGLGLGWLVAMRLGKGRSMDREIDSLINEARTRISEVRRMYGIDGSDDGSSGSHHASGEA